MINKIMTHDGIFKITEDEKIISLKFPELKDHRGEHLFVTKREADKFDGIFKNGDEFKGIPYVILTDYNDD
jgi:hypothetical protein